MANRQPIIEPDTQAGDEGTQALMQSLQLGFLLLKGIMALLLVIYVFSGMFVVRADEQAFVLRFGKIAGAPGKQVLNSGGWYWTWPKPIARVIRVKVKQSKTVNLNVFWYKETANVLNQNKNQPPPDGPLVPGTGGYLITGDSNIIHTKWTLTYQISDPIAWYLNYANKEEAIRDALSNAVLKQVAGTKVDDTLYGNAEDLRIRVQEEVTRIAHDMNIGIHVRLVTYDRRTPPQSTIAAFNKVVEANQIKSKKINDAMKKHNRIVRDAKGQAAGMVAEAESYRKSVVASVAADQLYFKEILKKYRQAPETMLLSLYSNTLMKVLTNCRKYIVKSGPTDEIRLLLSKRPINPNTPQKNPGSNR